MNILVAYDGSEKAKEALKLAQSHAKAFGAKIYLFHSKVTEVDPKGWTGVGVFKVF